MNNITEWMKSITPEQFRDFFMIRDWECVNCPAKDFCNTKSMTPEGMYKFHYV